MRISKQEKGCLSMHRLTTGLLAGSVMTAIGVGYVMSDKKAKRKMMKNGRKMASRAGHMIDDMTDHLF